MKGLGFVILSVVCTFLREVSLVICKGKSVVLELIVAKADVRCIHTRIRKPSCTQTLCLLRVAFGMITISTTCKPPLSQVFQCTLIITQLCFCAYTPLFFIWVRFSISVFAEITGCSISCHTEFRHRSEPVFLLSLLCIEDDHWKIISATHTHTHTYHKHRCMNTNTVTVQLYCAYQDRKNIWFVFSGKNKRDFQDFVIIMLIIFFTLSYVFIFFLLFFLHYLFFMSVIFFFFPFSPSIPVSSAASLWGGLMWAPDVEVDWLETERAEGFPILPSSHLSSSFLKPIFLMFLCLLLFSASVVSGSGLLKATYKTTDMFYEVV